MSASGRSFEVVDSSFGRHVLLVGAGFSRNWGGLLASEVQGSIFNHPAVQASPRLRAMVLDKPFEDAIEETRDGTWESEDQKAIEKAIRSTFEGMDANFRRSDPPVLNHTADDFISRFCPGPVGVGTAYVFSLNQDLLLERIYGHRADRQKLVIPGVTWLDRPPQSPAGAWPIPAARPMNATQLETVQLLRSFNHVKLHGSINWSDGSETTAMVIGRRKKAMISSHPLLSWNYQIFESVLASGDVKLMVVGYSWGDDHINDVIADAVKDHRLKVYSWNTLLPQDLIRPRHRGADILEGLAAYWTRPLTEVMPPKPADPGSPEYDNIIRTLFV